MKRSSYFIVVMVFLAGFDGYAQNRGQSDYNLRKAIELMENGDNVEAMEYLDRQLEETPENADAYLLRGQLHFYQEKYGDALSDMGRAIRYSGKDDIIPRYSKYWWRASVYATIEEYDRALADYDKAYRLAQKKDRQVLNDILANRARMFFDMGDYASSEADYRLMLKNNETDQRAMTGLARNMIASGRYEDAVQLADRCERYDRTYGETYLYRMQAHAAMCMTDKAIDDAILYYEYSSEPDMSEMESVLKGHLTYALAKVNGKISGNGDNREWRMLKTTVHELDHDYAAAVEEYNRIEKEYGTDAAIYYYRSGCYNELGYTDKAVSDITECMEMLGEDDYFSLVRRGGYYREGGDYEKAVADFTMAAELMPTDGYAYYMRGWCHELAGDDAKAMEDYNMGIDLDQSYPYIYLMRGEQYLKQGDTAKAAADFRTVLQKDTVARSGSARHYALHFLGKDDEALEWMDSIIAEDPDRSGSYYDKACLLSRMGRPDEAVLALRTALEKGYRALAHIENDDDIDPLRERSDFIGLMQEYREMPVYDVPVAVTDTSRTTVSEIRMDKLYSGVYEVPCDINGLPLKFILDTGASTVSISSVEASVAHNQRAPLLLGQSVLERFGTVTIDNINSRLVIML